MEVGRIYSERLIRYSKKDNIFNSKLIKALSSILEQLARSLTTHCAEYETFKIGLQETFEDYFQCDIFDISNDCSLFVQK